MRIPFKPWLWLYFGGWFIYFTWFWSHALFFNEVGDLVAGHVNIWGDWAAHFTMGSALAVRGWFIGSPIFEGSKFSYPFLADLFSGVLINAGVNFWAAFVI